MENKKYDVGTLVEVTNTNNKFVGIILQNLGECFVCRVLKKESGEVATAASERFGLLDSFRLQPYTDCVDISVLAKPNKLNEKNGIILGESISEESVDYYTVNLNKTSQVTFCVLDEDYFGWSAPYGLGVNPKDALTESYLKAKLSRIATKDNLK